ncbi:MAG: hypothetical protein LBL39_05550, partial [Planctomycetaceae bacterium]|nr:hypothetical protein [Planctomycetaceae bacterium]
AIETEELHGETVLVATLSILKNMTEGHEEDFDKSMSLLKGIKNMKQRIMYVKKFLNFAVKAAAAHGVPLTPQKIRNVTTPLIGENTVKSYFDELEEKGEARGIAKGEAKGKAEGKAEGKVEGRAEGSQNMVLKALQSKFTKAPKRIETTIRQISDLSALESLMDRVISSRTLNEFTASLK